MSRATTCSKAAHRQTPGRPRPASGQPDASTGARSGPFRISLCRRVICPDTSTSDLFNHQCYVKVSGLPTGTQHKPCTRTGLADAIAAPCGRTGEANGTLALSAESDHRGGVRAEAARTIFDLESRFSGCGGLPACPDSGRGHPLCSLLRETPGETGGQSRGARIAIARCLRPVTG